MTLQTQLLGTRFKEQDYGAEFLDEILLTCNSIAENPEIYPIVYRKTRRAVIHKFPFGIYYKIGNGLAIIVAVMHGSRDPNKWKSRTYKRMQSG